MWLEYLSVFGLGILELWLAVPAGLGLKLSPFVSGLLAAMGAIFSVVLVIAIGAPLRNWLLSLRKQQVESRESKTQKIWDKYGIAGFGLIAPIILGAHIGAAFAIAAGSHPKKVLLWFSAGVLMWTLIATLVTTAGFSLHQS